MNAAQSGRFCLFLCISNETWFPSGKQDSGATTDFWAVMRVDTVLEIQNYT